MVTTSFFSFFDLWSEIEKAIVSSYFLSFQRLRLTNRPTDRKNPPSRHLSTSYKDISNVSSATSLKHPSRNTGFKAKQSFYLWKQVIIRNIWNKWSHLMAVEGTNGMLLLLRVVSDAGRIWVPLMSLSPFSTTSFSLWLLLNVDDTGKIQNCFSPKIFLNTFCCVCWYIRPQINQNNTTTGSRKRSIQNNNCIKIEVLP